MYKIKSIVGVGRVEQLSYGRASIFNIFIQFSRSIAFEAIRLIVIPGSTNTLTGGQVNVTKSFNLTHVRTIFHQIAAPLNVLRALCISDKVCVNAMG